MVTLVPAVIPQSLEHLTRTLETVSSFTKEVQVDIVDGRFVPFTSWPYVPKGSVSDLQQFTKTLTIEVDLMVKEPERILHTYVDAGVQKIVLHLESLASSSIIPTLRNECRAMLGLSILNDTPLQALAPYLQYADYVQLMGIDRIGVQGQPFDERVLARIREVHALRPGIIVSIDGSVNQDTVEKLRNAGADRLVSGSAILSAPDPQRAFEALNATP